MPGGQKTLFTLKQISIWKLQVYDILLSIDIMG